MIKRRTIAAITLALASAGALAHSGAVISHQESGDNSYLASIVGSDRASHQAQDIKALNQALSIRSQLKTQGVPIPIKLDIIIDQLAVKSACASTKGLSVCENLTRHDVVNGVAAANLISGLCRRA